MMLDYKRHFYDLARRIDSADHLYDEIHQEECDFFFRYQLEEVRCVKRSTIEARRIISLIQKAISKGYDTSGIVEEHNDFFQKHGFQGSPQYDICEELVAEYKRIIEEEPSNAEAHYNLGHIYEKQGTMNAAISEYRIASYIDPDNADARRALKRLGKNIRNPTD
jgi:tetratricopeptide (TPR) repeat protein